MPFLLINKPKDWTSHDVVGYLRKTLGIKKVGHAGTLDPFATGLLIIGVERDATKKLDEFKNLPKKYIATIKLGSFSDTYDSTGNITIHDTHNMIHDTQKIESVLSKFIGKQKQTPPMYSAKKVQGKKLYELARKGIEVERKPSDIEIYSIKLLEYNYPILKIEISCSTGTYIRTLAHDIGKMLKTGAYCDELQRTEIGKYKLESSIEPKKINKNNIDAFYLDDLPRGDGVN
jgi:tRNA pseudouridine55 synthase